MRTGQALTTPGALAQSNRPAGFRALVVAGFAVGEPRERVGVPRGAGLASDQREERVILVRADFAHMNSPIAYLTENCCPGAARNPFRQGEMR